MATAQVHGLGFTIALEFDAVARRRSFIGRWAVERMDYYDVSGTVLGEHKIGSFGADPFSYPLVRNIVGHRRGGRWIWRLSGCRAR